MYNTNIILGSIGVQKYILSGIGIKLNCCVGCFNPLLNLRLYQLYSTYFQQKEAISKISTRVK